MRTFFVRNLTNCDLWDYMLCMHTSKYTKTNLGGFYIHKVGTQWESLLSPLKFLVYYSLLYWHGDLQNTTDSRPCPWMAGEWDSILFSMWSVHRPLFSLRPRPGTRLFQWGLTAFFFLSFCWWITCCNHSKRIQHWGWRIIGKLSKQ